MNLHFLHGLEQHRGLGKAHQLFDEQASMLPACPARIDQRRRNQRNEVPTA